MVLRDIRDLLHSMGKDIKTYGLPELVDTNAFLGDECMEVREEREVSVDQEHIDLINSLNSEQLAGFNDIMDHIMNKRSQVFFLDAPGGTGKTYVQGVAC